MTSSNSSTWKKVAAASSLMLFVLLASLCFGQQLTGTLTGTTMDSSGAVVANAKVTMKNELSGDIRTTVSNGSGYFSITAIQPGSYTVTVNAPGFKNWSQSGVTFAQGDNRNLPNIALQVGAVSETVEITSGTVTVPTDTSEVSTTLNQTLVEDVPILGRDAGELIKLMPGAASTNGLSQGSSFTDKTVGTNTGPVGSYSINGTQPYGSMSFMLDGANLVDPGNAGTQIANINEDMVSEVKTLMSSYSAEYAKGPVIFQAFSKSGGTSYHGEGYLYARNQVFNSWDAYNASQFNQALATNTFPAGSKARNLLIQSLHPDESFYYMGGNIGGPILPHSKKLFFWGGYEYMRQHPAGSIHNYNVPTAEQRAGDFSETTIDGAPGYTMVNGNPQPTPLLQQLQSTWGYAYNIPWNIPTGSTKPFAAVPVTPDPNAIPLMNFYPKANQAPAASNGYNNYLQAVNTPQNRWEATGKVDYNFSENTKLTGSYTRQIEKDSIPFEMWWAGPSWSLPYPSLATAPTTSQEIMVNLTHVFSPTTTNEAVFTYARYINPASLANPAAVDRNKIGFNVHNIFPHQTAQIPDLIAPWGGTFPDIRQVSFTENFGAGKGVFGALKKDPSLYDNFTKVLGSHTLKVGAYWDTSGNVQSSGGFAPNDKGAINYGWSGSDTGNIVADWLTGTIGNYQEVSFSPSSGNYIRNHQWSIYGQDQFKANRQLTLNYGLRLDHVGQWYGPSAGAQVWDPGSYVNGTGASQVPTNLQGTPLYPNTGLSWHAINHSIPLSGFKSPLFYYEPRVGFAYDVFGTGKTVLRAGFAEFRYQFSVNDVGGPMVGPQGIFTFTALPKGTSPYNPNAANPSCTGYQQINCPGQFTVPSSVAQNGATISVIPRGDNRTPTVFDWNVTISQALPWRSVLEVSYVANKSQNELLNGQNDKVSDLNSVQPGGYFFGDPVLTAANGGVPFYVSTSALPCNQKNNANNAVDCSKPSPNTVNYAPCFAAPPNNVPGSGTSGTLACNYNAGLNANDYRPLTQYNDIYLITHGGYSNYNSLQVTWQKSSGPMTFLTNYTFSKVLGTRDGQTNNGAGNGKAVDPFNLKNNYAPLAYDHTHILNFAAVYNLPKPIRDNKLLGGAVNGWQLSTYTTYQAGAPLQPNLGGNLNANFAGGLTVPLNGAPDLPDNSIVLPNGLKSVNVNPGSWYGTDGGGGGYTVMVPALSCDPRHHASGAFFNPNCFTTPAYGAQGAQVWPYLRGPAYFDSDLGLFKNFQISERQKVQFRLSAVNWLNHPLSQFGLAGTADESLNFTRRYTVTIPDETTAYGSECAFLGQTAANGTCQVMVTGISPTNTNTATTGKPAFKTGSRQLTFALKYYF